MINQVRLAPAQQPSYRRTQEARLRPNLRVGLLSGAVASSFFIPWQLLHDPNDNRLTTLNLIALTVALSILFLLTYTKQLGSHLGPITFVASIVTCASVSFTLYRLPDGFLYGVAIYLIVMVVTTVLAIDLSLMLSLLLLVVFVSLPNVVMVWTDVPSRVLLHANWILVTGALVSFGLAFLMDLSHRRAFLLEQALFSEKERADGLLSSLLPSAIANRLKRGETTIAEVEPNATVVFADLVGFTALAHRLSPPDLIAALDEVFRRLDTLAERNGLEKIKTIGDEYMAAAGVADSSDRGPIDVAEFALDAVHEIDRFATESGLPLELRVGFTCGPVVSGVIGKRKPHFDLWGETVNLASRLQSAGQAGTIQVDLPTARRLGDGYAVESAGVVELRGIGTIEVAVLTGRRHESTEPRRGSRRFRLLDEQVHQTPLQPMPVATHPLVPGTESGNTPG